MRNFTTSSCSSFIFFVYLFMVIKMNDNIINEITTKLNINKKQVINTLNLLKEGNTIPFIARYRKEATSNLDEVMIKEISDKYNYELNLLKRKEDVIRLIEEKGLLTLELKNKILACKKLVEVEDLYRPYKEKKKTKASEALNKGLLNLAKQIMTCPLNTTIEELAKNYSCKEENDEEKIKGAFYIVAEIISDNSSYRKWLRNYILNNGLVVSKLKKGNDKEDEKKTFFFGRSAFQPR